MVYYPGRGGYGMKRFSLVVLAAVVLLGLSGCFSTGFMGFLATTEQVDKKIADQEAKVAKDLEGQKAELAKIQQDIADIQALKQQAEEMRTLAKDVEERLTTLPKETLQKLVDIVQNALNKE
jgi:uncharacterized membrane protein